MDYRVKLECCGTDVRVKLPNKVRPLEVWLDCLKCDTSTICQDVRPWQEGTDDMLTNTERAYEPLRDCRAARLTAA